jgi:L-lactate dehydrogenase
MNTKISVIGGAGSVGATTAYALTLSGFVKELVLVDIAKDKTEGEALDLNHGAAFISPMHIRSGDYEDTKDSKIVIITAGIPQRPGQTRMELVQTNIEVFKSIIPEVVKYSPDAILLVVSNPVDILSYVTYELSGFPKERVIGSGTVLDTSRFQYEIGKNFGIDPRDVHTYILGEHGDTSFPAWSLTNIGGIQIDKYAKLMDVKYDDEFKHSSYENVKNAAYEVINKKGATYYAIALTITHIVGSILKDKKCILPISTLINDYYNIDDVYMGIPSILGRNGVEKVLKVPLNDEEVKDLHKSANALKTVLNDSYLE